MRIFLLCFYFLLLAFGGFAQSGHYYISHYSQDRQAGAFSFDMAQDARGFMYFANRKGLTQFDGKNWLPISSPSIIYSLSVDQQGNVFAAGEGIIGQVIVDANYNLKVSPILTNSAFDYFESLRVGELLYFLAEQELVTYQTASKKIDKIKPLIPEDGFSHVFELNGNVYVSTLTGTNYQINGNKLAAASTASIPAITKAFRFGNQSLMVTEDQRFFLADQTDSIREIKMEDANYLKSGRVVAGVWVHETLLALGTLNGGVVFVNPRTGKTEEIINYYSGLPDNEVFCMRADAEGNVWVGHEYGFSCIAPQLPFRSFNHYTGLSGNILCAKTFNDKVYVGTSVGLFLLVKEDQYMDEIYYVDKKTKVTKQAEQIPAATNQEEPAKKKGLQWFRRKKEQQEALPTVYEKSETVITKVRMTRKVLMGSTYSFKKVAGIETKVEKLLNHKGQLFAAGIAGLYEVIDNKAFPLVQEPVEGLASTEQFGIVGETYKGQIFALSNKEVKTLIEDINDDVTAIVEDENGILWISGTNKIYRFKLGETITEYAYANPSIDRTEALRLKEGLLLVNTNGFYTVVNGAVRNIDSLGKASQYFVAGNNLWYRQQEIWKSKGAYQQHENLKFLNVFSELRYIDAEEADAIWVVTKDNELFRFYSNRSLPNLKAYPFIIRSIRNQDTFFEPGSEQYKIPQDGGPLTIDITQPSFGSQQGAQYRYAMQGGDFNGWSEWTNSNLLNFPYLALGSYELKIQTKDALGRISELEVLRIRIDPPFWKTPWFYATEFLIFSLLVVLSIRLQALNNRYRVVAQVLSMLTIVLLITLIQAAVGTYFVSSSPVMDFGIQVGIAFLVLPVELILRRVMLSTSEKNRLYKIINPSSKKEESTED